MRRYLPLTFALLFAAAFLGTALLTWQEGHAQRIEASLDGRVVVSAPVQVLLYAGDRFLGANLETMRIAASGGGTVEADAAYIVRAHRVVAQLNPCHEDNYYLGNALLSWGGVQSEGDDLLRRATECRHWDEFPPFFYGINQYFFRRDVKEAQRAFEIAAARASDNAAALKKLAIMVAVSEIEDLQMALAYLRRETDQATDPKLKEMLEKRVRRLEGLATLRDAQARYEQRFGRPLAHPNELLAAGILEDFPADPLRIGYEFRDGTFQLGEWKIEGLERQ